jgi:hypothetical protein
MNKTLAIVILSAAAVAAPIAARAGTAVSIAVDTPSFGLRVGGPYGVYAPVPVYAPPLYAPAPVYLPPPVVYVPPRVVVPAPVVYPAYPYVYGPRYGHWKHPHRHVTRPVVPAGYGYAYGRY